MDNVFSKLGDLLINLSSAGYASAVYFAITPIAYSSKVELFLKISSTLLIGTIFFLAAIVVPYSHERH